MDNSKPTLLITGGAGFIGSNFVTYFTKKHPDKQLINIDKLTYASSVDYIANLPNKNYTFIQGDITDVKFVNELFNSFTITGIINFAAESHVDRSINCAKTFMATNVYGAFNLINSAKTHWEKQGNIHTNRFHQISTDEVYGSLGANGSFHEDTPYDPRNPYSASKASADLIVKSFAYTYGMNVVISSCSNNYGPNQHKEKFIPTIISKAIKKEEIPIYGDGENIRDWLYVMDHCRAIDLIFHHANRLDKYNIGGNCEQTNNTIAKKVCALLDEHPLTKKDGFKHEQLITYIDDRLGHDRRYSVDDSKLRKNLGWKQKVMLEEGLEKTVDWYVRKWKEKIC
ncbi:dTDP-glucose 4,6-dehydratase [Pseudogracilibacillus sp. SE30717A]|uniref:dTDP-glucose 4,6-dehydratase n=1 Tax=Pseudogracilibacillus sp. SE30717A TaxID=3098293 RepID=UPI00300E222E